MKKKKRILGVLIAILFSLVFTTGCQFLVFIDIFNDKTTEPPVVTTEPPVVVDTDELSVHFLELGNRYTGDSVYIKIGDVEIPRTTSQTMSIATARTARSNTSS